MGIEEAAVSKENDNQHIPTIVSQQMVTTEITEELSPGQHRRRHPQSLVLEIPSRSGQCSPEDSLRISIIPALSPTTKRVNFSPTRSTSNARLKRSSSFIMPKDKSSFKNLLPKLSFKFKNSSTDVEKAAILALVSPSSVRGGRSRITRTFSLSKFFTSRRNKASSLPVTPILHSNPGSIHGDNKGRPELPIHRSHSVPVLNKDGSIRQKDSLGGVFRVVPTNPQVKEGTSMDLDASATVANDNYDNGEDIPEDEAVCRICFVELGEGSDTLRMECSCKGELALAHQECIVKWFSIKGNKICDICKQEVRNLPVTLLRIQNAPAQQGDGGQQNELTGRRGWQDVPVLVIVSMLAYFCFLEQLLVKKMGSGAIAISIPFSCILGLLASMTSTTMVTRRFVWVYAAVQFIMVVLFAHILYSLLHMQAVVSVLVATFVGFGITMCGCSVLFEILRWGSIWQARFNAQRGAVEGVLASTEAAPNQPETQTGDPESSHGR